MDSVYPKVEIVANLMDYLCAMLSKAGYGSVDLLKSYDSATFFSIYDYERYINDYNSEFIALNRKN